MPTSGTPTPTQPELSISPQLRDRLARLIPFEPRPTGVNSLFGWAFDLATDPIPPQVYDLLLDASIQTRAKQACGVLGVSAWGSLGKVRQEALIELLFYVPVHTLRTELRLVIQSLRKKDWRGANKAFFKWLSWQDFIGPGIHDAVERLTSGLEPHR